MSESTTPELDALLEQIQGEAGCYDADKTVLVAAARIAERVHRKAETDLREAKARAACDACAGQGTPVSGKPCVCGGSGLAQDAVVHLRERLLAEERHVEKLTSMLHDLCRSLVTIIHESSGVAGYHLNGDLAPWDELRDNSLHALDDALDLFVYDNSDLFKDREKKQPLNSDAVEPTQPASASPASEAVAMEVSHELGANDSPAAGPSPAVAGPSKCSTCEGCGKVATDEDRTPWTFWADLPLKSSGAVIAGLVKPIACPDCGGTGIER